MRLTLRTLLAYRDGVLDASDAVALETKIKESATAQHISQRIEEGMRNRRIAPIPVDAREFGFEANLVAEFLDDTISHKTLPDMERKCLENNALLCEIGSCHQIISRALSVPAYVSGSLRQQIVALPQTPVRYSTNLSVILERHGRLRRIDPANHGYIPGLQAASIAATSSGLASGSVPTIFPSSIAMQSNGSAHSATSSTVSPKVPVTIRKQKAEIRTSGIELHDGLGKQVPEYLIGSDRGWLKRALIAASLLVALISAGILAIGPLDRVQSLLKKSPTQLTDSIDKPKTRDTLTRKKDSAVLDSEADIEIASTSVAPPKPSGTDAIETPMATLPTPTPSSPLIARLPVPAPDAGKRTEASNSTVSPATASPATASPATISPKTIDLEKQNSAAKLTQDSPPKKLQAAIRVQWLPVSKESTECFVLKRSTGTNDWSKMIAGEIMEAGQQLVIGPAQRTELRIAPGLQWICAGDTDLEIARPESSSPLKFKSGRALVFATPDSQQISLDCNGFLFQLQFENSDSSCAIEVTNTLASSTDQQLAAGVLNVNSEVTIFGIQGNTTVTRGGDVVLAVGQFAKWTKPDVPPNKQDLKETPWWFRTSIERPIDQVAVNDIQRSLLSGNAQEPMLLLAKLASDRQPETAALAIRIRIATGDYSQLFSSEGVYNRKGFHIQWGPISTQIAQSLGRTENRQKLVESIRRDAPGRADSLLSLLIPKSQEQLLAGEDKLLIESLTSSSMDERILAIQQLTRITGKSLGYQPDKNYVDSIPAWRKSLSRSEIRYPPIDSSKPSDTNSLKKVPNQ